MTSELGRPVVVGVDGSDSALDAVRWSAAEAARRGCGLRLVAAVASTMFRPIGLPQLGQEYQRRAWEQAADTHLAAAVAAAHETAATVDVQHEVRDGEAPVVLRDESERAALLVLGSRGRGGFTGLLLGSVAISAMARAACPLVVVRGHGVADGPVLVGVHGPDEQDDPVITFGCEQAALRGTSLVAVHTWYDAVLDPLMFPYPDPAAILIAEEQALEKYLAGWRDKYPGVEMSLAVVLDGAARELITRSAEASLVVVGSRGRGPLGGLVLGSVSQAVLQHAAGPVAVVGPESIDQR